MTALYNQFLADPGATKNWLATLWPYNPAAVQPDLLGDGATTYGIATVAMPAGSMAMGCWVRPRTSLSSLRYLAGVQNGTAAGQRVLYLAGSAANDPAFAVRNDSGTQFSIDSSSGYSGGIPAGAWAYIAAVLNTVLLTISLYINGALINTAAVTGTFNTVLSNLTVLRAADASSGFLDGEISELSIYASALTPLTGPTNPLYPIFWNNGIPQPQVGSLISATGPYAYYRLNDGSGTTAADTSGNSRASLALTSPIWGTGDWGTVQPIYLSSGGVAYGGGLGFNTLATDTPANMCYRPDIGIPPLMKRSMYSGSTIGGYSTPDYGQLDIKNADGFYDFLRTYAFDGRRMLIQYGGQLSANLGGTLLALSDYGTVFDGVGSGDALIDEQACSVLLKSKDWTFDKPLQTNYYTSPCPMSSAATDYIGVPGFPAQTGSLTVEFWIYLADAVTAQRAIFMDDATHGWAINLNVSANGTIRFLTRDLSSVGLETVAASLNLNSWTHVACVYDHSAQTKTIYLSGVSASTVGALTGALVAPSQKLSFVGAPAGTGCSNGTKISEVRIWNVARTATQILQNRLVRLSGSETGLIGYWGLRDGGLAKVVADLSSSANPGYMFGGLTWDVADWVDPSVAGKTIPLTYGEVLELQPATPDPFNLAYQVHDRAILKVQAVYDKGLALAAPLSYTGTDISFSATGNTITGTAADFSSLVVGQQVTSSATNNGNTVFTVASVGTNSFTVTQTLVNASAGPSITLSATTPQYTVDLARGLIYLLTLPAGKVTAWVRGDNPAGSLPTGGYPNTGADIIRRVVTRHGSLNDPADILTASFASYKSAAPGVCGIFLFGSASQGNLDLLTHASTTAGKTLKVVVDEVASTGGAFYGLTRISNQLQVAQFQGVSGSPVASFDTTNVNVTPQHQTLALELPVWMVIVGYAQNYAVLSASELAGDVQLNPTRFAFCTNQWRYAWASDSSVLATYSQARTLVILSNYVNYADALAEAKRQLALFKVRRDLYKITAAASNLYSLDINQAVTYTRNRFGLNAGRNFCVLAFDEQSNNGGAASGSGTLGQLGNPAVITADIWA